MIGGGGRVTGQVCMYLSGQAQGAVQAFMQQRVCVCVWSVL
jgi:hypothetical protein